MAIKIKSSTETFLASQPDETFIMEADATIEVLDADGDGIAAFVQAAGDGGRIIRLGGTVVAGDTGVFVSNFDRRDPERLIIEATGLVSAGETGVSTGGISVNVANAGTIQSDETAVFLASKQITLDNSGRIEGTKIGVSAFGDGLTAIINSGLIRGGNNVGLSTAFEFRVDNSGTILSDDVGIRIQTPSENGAAVINTGLIKAPIAIEASEETEGAGFFKLVNRGAIEGFIDFEQSVRNDVFDLRGGLLMGDLVAGEGNNRFTLTGAFRTTGAVSGGLGDDVYTIDNIVTLSTISEGANQGTDTVRSRVSVSFSDQLTLENITLLGKADIDATGNGLANIMIGNSGDNEMSGEAGADTIRAGKGNDSITTGTGADVIIFRTGDGRDVIRDFVTEGPSPDILDLTDIAGISNFNDLKNNHITIDGDDLIIDLGGGDRIRLDNEDIAQLGPTHFLL